MDASWSADAARILDRACTHYDIAAWRALRVIRLFPEELSGALPWLKGVGRTFPLPPAIEVYPHERRTVFLDYPVSGQTGVFDNGDVRIEDKGGAVILASRDHRRVFRGFAKNRRWAPADALYFFGYALWHYHTLPFSLDASRLIRVITGAVGDAARQVLDVEFPADVPTHSRRQSFHFTADGVLTRHDYCAEVIGTWARGAHLWHRQKRVNGFPVAMERRVVPHVGAMLLPGTALYARFGRVEVEGIKTRGVDP